MKLLKILGLAIALTLGMASVAYADNHRGHHDRNHHRDYSHHDRDGRGYHNRYRGQRHEYVWRNLNGHRVQYAPIWCVNLSGNRWVCDWERVW